MHCYTSSLPWRKPQPPWRADGLAWLLGACLCVMALWAAAGTARAQSVAVDVSHMQLERDEEGVFLSAAVQFELPSIVEDALRRGVPMFFVAEAEILRSRWYWADEKVANSARYTRLVYQPLTRRWRVNMSPTPIGSSGLGVTLNQSFDELEDALALIQRISRWKIAEASVVSAQNQYNVDFRFRLDTSQLPRPFQIGVAGRSDWSLSGTHSTPLPAESAP